MAERIMRCGNCRQIGGGNRWWGGCNCLECPGCGSKIGRHLLANAAFIVCNDCQSRMEISISYDASFQNLEYSLIPMIHA